MVTSHRPPTFTGLIELTLAQFVPPLLSIRDPFGLIKTCVTLKVLMGDPAGIITGSNCVKKSKLAVPSVAVATAAAANETAVNVAGETAGTAGIMIGAGTKPSCSASSGLLAIALRLLTKNQTY